MDHARAIHVALIPYAVALAVPAHAAADLSVTVTLRPPQGCSASVTATGANGAPQVTLTCGSNLFVNVQPTILTAPVGAAPITSPALTGGSGGGAFDGAPPASTFDDVSSLMNLDDPRASVGGAMFVQRRVAAAEGQGVSPGANLTQVLVEPAPGAAGNAAAQPVEMWLIF